jgi:antitoxin component YwqK of YwqJK toxin-antitoxin module
MKAVGGTDDHGQPRHGPFRQYFKNGMVACEGEFVQGRKTGVWTYFLANGQVKAVGRYADDLLVGDWEWYRENGQLMQTGSFSTEGLKHGRWRRYDPAGALLDETDFEHGKRKRA